MKSKSVKQMTFQELEQLHSGSLLARLKALRSLDESFETSDWLPEERDVSEAAGEIAFKDIAEWKAAVCDVKVLLATREHMTRGSKEKRQEAAFRKQKR